MPRPFWKSSFICSDREQSKNDRLSQPTPRFKPNRRKIAPSQTVAQLIDVPALLTRRHLVAEICELKLSDNESSPFLPAAPFVSSVSDTRQRSDMVEDSPQYPSILSESFVSPASAPSTEQSSEVVEILSPIMLRCCGWQCARITALTLLSIPTGASLSYPAPETQFSPVLRS
jgi:hypothetical protein